MELKKVLDEIFKCEESLEAINRLSYAHSRGDDRFYLGSDSTAGVLRLDLPTVSSLIEAKEKSLRERLSQLQEAKNLAEKVIHGLLND
ncbi:hypothetical protein [Serratia sp. UGAL515B_01]|uniref:hypothetical protein n=1 Tax=Serratia sp. UGAL515B_01 TaxID=2986763 RepID=UPI0029549317|nr:hypothetical protein [Serratia sp. UGAL515B_01]WON77546.1 hypothetical protein OK023_02235 [Serratia sp. UGAL515B_01]